MLTRGREYTEDEVRALPTGSSVWVYYAKDGDPNDVRFDEAHRITSKSDREFKTDMGCEDWPYNGNTSRGYARYYACNSPDAQSEGSRTIYDLLNEDDDGG